MTLVGFADDILNFSRQITSLESNFNILSSQYGDIGLSFNVSKSEVMLFNWNKSVLPHIQLGSQSVEPVESLVYLGLPIGDTLSSTRSLIITHIERKIRTAYGATISSKRNLNRFSLARIYNAVAVPHILYITPFWKLLRKEDKFKIRRIFFRYLKFLLQVPLRTSNSYLIRRYAVTDPFSAVNQLLDKYCAKLEGSSHPWLPLLSSL